MLGDIFSVNCIFPRQYMNRYSNLLLNYSIIIIRQQNIRINLSFR